MTMLVSASNLSRNYLSGSGPVVALNQVSFDVDDGEFVAIMGPSGSGKTTLMNLIGLLDQPSNGSLIFAGQDVTALSFDEKAAIRSRKIGFVFQTFNLLARNTALENVELPLLYAGVPKAERVKRAVNALQSVRLGHRDNHWPTQLSGGEQQRVAIARAIVTDPALILADEPTGALDSNTGQVILAHFQALNRSGRSVIMVTHDAEVAHHADRIVEMRDGIILNDGMVHDRLDASAALNHDALAQQLREAIERGMSAGAPPTKRRLSRDAKP
jgi:putative ABC transport system ATP-binding protein